MRSNKFPGTCNKCSRHVAARSGFLSKLNGRWTVTHRHDCTTDAVTAIESAQATQERAVTSAAHAAGRADHFQWELAWELDRGNF